MLDRVSKGEKRPVEHFSWPSEKRQVLQRQADQLKRGERAYPDQKALDAAGLSPSPVPMLLQKQLEVLVQDGIELEGLPTVLRRRLARRRKCFHDGTR